MVVYPAASLIGIAPKKARKILINPEIPDGRDWKNFELIAANAGHALPQLASRLIEELVD